MTLSLIFLIFSVVSLVMLMVYISVTSSKLDSCSVYTDMGYIFLMDVKNMYRPVGNVINVFALRIQRYNVKKKRQIIRRFFKYQRLDNRTEEKVARKSYFDTIIKPKKMLGGINIK